MKTRLSVARLGRVAVLFTVFCRPMVGSVGTCGGGEGPVPFLDISHLKNPKIQTLRQDARNFLFWERKNQIIIRTYDDELRRYSLHSGFMTGLSNIDFPIANVTDPKNQYIVTDGENSVFDVNHRRWETFDGARNPVHTFWSKGRLYTIDYSLNAANGSVIDVYAYQPRTKVADFTCSISLMNSPNERIRMAHGFYAPYALFYSIKEKKTSYELKAYPVNVENCAMIPSFIHTHTFPDPILAVYSLSSSKSFGVFTAGKRENFYYMDSGSTSCPAYHLETDRPPAVVDGEAPALAAWTPQTGLRIYNIGTREYFELLRNAPVAELGMGDIQISRDHNQLVLSPLMLGENKRQLMHVQFQPLPTPLPPAR